MKNLIKKILKSLITISILSFLIFFMVNNRDYIFINFSPFQFEIEARIFIILAISFLFGFIVAMIIYSKDLMNSNLRTIFKHKNHKKSAKKSTKK